MLDLLGHNTHHIDKVIRIAHHDRKINSDERERNALCHLPRKEMLSPISSFEDRLLGWISMNAYLYLSLVQKMTENPFSISNCTNSASSYRFRLIFWESAVTNYCLFADMILSYPIWNTMQCAQYRKQAAASGGSFGTKPWGVSPFGVGISRLGLDPCCRLMPGQPRAVKLH